jgi:hypothetical protein
MNKSRTKTVTIPKDIMDEINQMDDRSQQGRKLVFTPEMDAILVHLMDNKNQHEAISWWKKKYGWGSRDALVRRYKEVKEASNGR